MTSIDLGKISITLGGDWMPNVKYEKLTAVMRKGEGYISRDETLGEDPQTFGNKWMKFAEHGESLYDLMVEEGLFVGTLEEFLQEYENTLQAARDITAATQETNTEVSRAEEQRVQAEQGRVAAENLRALAEQGRERSEGERQAAEINRQAETEAAVDIASHPDYIGADNYVYRYNPSTHTYARTDIYTKGVSIESVEQVETSTESGGINTIRVTLSNGTSEDFYVRNGEKVVPTVANEVLSF